MKKFLILFGCLLVAGVLAAAQDSGGTINWMSSNPYQNQEMTSSMGSTTGQPTDLAGERDLPSGLVPVTTTMEGSGSNGNLNQSEPAVPIATKQPIVNKQAGSPKQPAGTQQKKPAAPGRAQRGGQ